MGGSRIPGIQGLGAGGTQRTGGGISPRACVRNNISTNGNPTIKQHRSWAIGSGQMPAHASRVAYIYFQTNSYHLDQDDRTALNNLDSVLRNIASETGYGAILLAVGSADHRGEAGYNLRLAARRALAVEKYLKAKKTPGLIVLARTLGEAFAQQPDLCRGVAQQQMAEDRRVEVIYAKYKIIIGDDVDVIITPLPKVIEDAKRVISEKKSIHPNQCKRLQCYITKLEQPANVKNDSYWSYGDWLACWKYAFVNGKFTEAGLRRGAKEIMKRRKSAREFLRKNVATTSKDDAKFTQLLLLDKTIFDSWQKVADRLASSATGSR